MNTKDRIAQFRATPERMNDNTFEALADNAITPSALALLVTECRRARASEAEALEALVKAATAMGMHGPCESNSCRECGETFKKIKDILKRAGRRT